MSTRRGARVAKRSVKTPGGKVSKHRRVGKVKAPKCAKCGRVLGGTAHGRVGKVRGLAKSRRHPTRPFGGNLCPTCSRARVKAAARA